MNWIKLLYPKPTFHVSPWLGRFRSIHEGALRIAYYISQTLALILLALFYVIFICPVKILILLRRQDILDQNLPLHQESYLKKSEAINSSDFTRMF